MPTEAPEDLVDVSSGDSSEEEEEEEREGGPDSEATDGESRAPLPRRRSRTLRLLPSDDEDDGERGGERSPPIRKKDMTGLFPRGSVSAPRRSTNTPPAPEPLEADPCSRLSGFKYGRRLLELVSYDQ